MVITGRFEQWSGRLLLAGSTIWLVCWLLQGQTAHGAVAVLGLSERGWRRRARYGRLGLAGFVTTQCGLAAILIGNFIVFWIGEWLYVETPGVFKPTDHIGW